MNASSGSLRGGSLRGALSLADTVAPEVEPLDGARRSGSSGSGRSVVSLNRRRMAVTGASREVASLRNTTVLPEVESRGSSVRLRPRTETRYQRLGALGRGAMGEVSLVRDNDIGRTVALKQLHGQTQGPDGVARFIEEIRTVGRLEHPNIVPIHDVGVDDQGQPFFVMKHIDGETLERVLQRLEEGDPEYLARFTIDARIEIFLGILRALQCAHKSGVIHRDIKPANVMIGRLGEVVLMDWGVAKVTSPSGERPRASQDGPLPYGSQDGPLPYGSQDGMIIGTPAYMSPEQANGQVSATDARSDLYSAAVLFHELLAVRHYLAHCTTQQQLMTALFSERFSYLRLVFVRHPKHPVPPAELLHFIAKGLAKEPERRFQSADEMIAALLRIRDGRCQVSCPATLAKRMVATVGGFVSRYPKLSPFVFFSVFLLLLSSVFLSAYVLATQAL